MKSVNLIPKHRRAARQRRTAMAAWAAGSGAYAAVLALAYVGYLLGLTGTSRVAAAELEAVTASLEETKRSITQVQPLLQEARKNVDVARAVSEQPDWSLLIGLVSQTQGEDVVLRGCRLEPADQLNEKDLADKAAARAAALAPPISRRPFRLTLQGLGRTQSAVSQFVLRLEKLGPFDQVTLVETSREPFLEDEAFAFRVECTLGTARRVGR